MLCLLVDGLVKVVVMLDRGRCAIYVKFLKGLRDGEVNVQLRSLGG
jgi:hypothetical protein